MSQDEEEEEDENQVDGDDEQEGVQSNSENVDNVCLHAAFEFHLGVGQFTVRVEAIVDQGEEDDEGIKDNDGEDESNDVLVVPPVLVCVADLAPESRDHVGETSEDCRWQVRNSMQASEPDHHDERERDEPLSVFSASRCARLGEVRDEEETQEREDANGKLFNTPIVAELPLAEAAHVLVCINVCAESLLLISIDLL